MPNSQELREREHRLSGPLDLGDNTSTCVMTWNDRDDLTHSRRLNVFKSHLEEVSDGMSCFYVVLL